MIDALGDRMKDYEMRETGRRFLPMLPVYARIDGRGFSKFTRGMNRPFDYRMSAAMIETVRTLVERTHARIGFTQSDEISLVWQADGYEQGIFFDGKVQKMVSVLAGLATAAFTRAVLDSQDEEFRAYAERLPHFDCRVYQLPTRTEAANAFVWRVKDATRNAVSMVAQHHFSHKQLQNKSTTDMLAMLAAKDVHVETDFPEFFRHGTFVRRVTEVRSLSEAELARIPENKRPAPGHTFERSAVKAIPMPLFVLVKNREEVLFDGAEAVQ